MIKQSPGRKVFLIINCSGLILIAIICLLPFIHLLAVSLSSADASNAGRVRLLPVDLSFKAYEFVFSRSGFVRAFFISVYRTVLGSSIGIVLTLLTAYPLSKTSKQIKGRGFFVAFFFFTAFFSGGLIPTYMVLNAYGMLNTIWALVLPNAVIFFNLILMVNFFRSIPKSLEEAAIIDGASHFTVFLSVYLPLSKPGIATVLLFIAVFHWNSWFDGIIYMNSPDRFPLQSYLSNLILPVNVNMLHIQTGDAVSWLRLVSERSIKAANVFLGALPIMLVYPFLQRYFIKGIMLGSIKG